MPVAVAITVKCHQPRARAGEVAGMPQVHQAGDDGGYGSYEPDPDREHRSGRHGGFLEPRRAGHEHRDASGVGPDTDVGQRCVRRLTRETPHERCHLHTSLRQTCKGRGQCCSHIINVRASSAVQPFRPLRQIECCACVALVPVIGSLGRGPARHPRRRASATSALRPPGHRRVGPARVPPR